MKYEVTIGIPVYKVVEYIGKALDSVLTQTFGSIEILIVDDDGCDGSMDVIRDYQENHPRGSAIRILKQSRNMGVSAARNRIIDEAAGRYLFFMDADDLISPDCIEKLYGKMTTTGADIVYGSYDKMGIDGSLVERFQYPDVTIDGEDKFAAYAYRKLGGIQAAVWNALMSISFLRGTGLKMIRSAFWEDFVFTFDLATFVRKAVLMSDITYYYMCREGSLSNYQARERVSRDEVMANARTINHLKATSPRLKGKPYYRKRMVCIMKMDLYILRDIFRRWKRITPRITPRDIWYIISPTSA